MSFDPFHSQQLDKIAEEITKIDNLIKSIEDETEHLDTELLKALLHGVKLLHHIDHKLGKLIDLLNPNKEKAIASFNITQQGEIPMSVAQGPLAGIAAGATATLTANPFDPSGNPSNPASVAPVVLVWTSSDPVNFPVASSGTAGDLTATVAPPATADPAATATISVAQVAPLADGSNATGSATESIVTVTPPPPPPVAIAQFIITQS